jgi:peptidoglycan/LPS O-acetylase OafA/YrhL
MDMNLKYKAFLALGSLLILAGLLVPMAGWNGGGDSASVLMTIGVVIIAVMALSLWRRGEDIEADERTKKIGAYGFSYSWLLTLILLFLLFWIDRLDLMELTAGDVLLAAILVMTISAKAFQWHLSRKGDVD